MGRRTTSIIAGKLWLVLAPLVLAPDVAAHPASFVRVQVPVANVREGPATDFSRLRQARRDEPLRVVGREGRWLEVRDHEGQAGWIFAPLTDDQPAVVVHAVREWANVRSGPGRNHAVRFRAPRGSTFAVAGGEGDWLRVQDARGGSGWLHRSLTWGAGHSPAYVRVKVDFANVRVEPSRDGEVRWQVYENFPLEVVGREGSWLRTIDFGGAEGWIYASLTDTEPAVVVIVDTANVRAGPGLRHSAIWRARWGEAFRLLEREEQWVRIEGVSGRRGWVHEELVWGAHGT
jgi:SH3-like domain-containing protein